jgi:hypothetical protein
MLRIGGLLGLTACLFVASGVTSGSASARACPPATVGGPSVGMVKVGNTKVPLKNVAFRPGGTLNPPATHRAAGISTVNAPLGAEAGVTVITWHVQFGAGCTGALNDLLTLPVGTTFTASQRGGSALTYRISERFTTPKGRYKWQWFRADGPHRLALFTCTDFRAGAFRSNVVVFADPVMSPIEQPAKDTQT